MNRREMFQAAGAGLLGFGTTKAAESKEDKWHPAKLYALRGDSLTESDILFNHHPSLRFEFYPIPPMLMENKKRPGEKYILDKAAGAAHYNSFSIRFKSAQERLRVFPEKDIDVATVSLLLEWPYKKNPYREYWITSVIPYRDREKLTAEEQSLLPLALYHKSAYLGDADWNLDVLAECKKVYLQSMKKCINHAEDMMRRHGGVFWSDRPAIQALKELCEKAEKGGC